MIGEKKTVLFVYLFSLTQTYAYAQFLLVGYHLVASVSGVKKLFFFAFLLQNYLVFYPQRKKNELFRRSLRPFEALVVFFITELQKAEDSSWAPYVKVLPRSFTTPAMLDPDLQPSCLPVYEKDLLVAQRKELNEMYNKVSLSANTLVQL